MRADGDGFEESNGAREEVKVAAARGQEVVID
jgi:hypothetical protein